MSCGALEEELFFELDVVIFVGGGCGDPVIANNSLILDILESVFSRRPQLIRYLVQTAVEAIQNGCGGRDQVSAWTVALE